MGNTDMWMTFGFRWHGNVIYLVCYVTGEMTAERQIKSSTHVWMNEGEMAKGKPESDTQCFCTHKRRRPGSLY